MRRFALLVLLNAASAWPLQAETWRALQEAEMREVLTGSRVIYSAAWQTFGAGGKTLYNAGRDSWGNWRIADDRYCSQWPPNTLWVCYGVERKGDEIRFVGPHGDISGGRLEALD